MLSLLPPRIKAFMVAKMMNLDLLRETQASLIKAQLKGLDFEGWKKELLPALKKKGWWGETEVTNPATGEVKKIFIGNRRLKTIFNTNMRVAYHQSRARAQYALEGDILLRYVAILDHRTRDSHKKMHGTLLPRGHNFWKLNYPPNGWNCRCRVNAYTRAEAKAKGWEETEDKFLPEDGIADKDWRYDTRNLEGEWAELDQVYLNKANRIIQGAHPSIKDHIQKGLREIEEERRVKRELWTAFDEMKAAKDNKKRTRELTRLPPVDIIDLSDDLKKRLSLSLDREVSITAERIWLSRETIASHFHHGEIEAIDYFMVRFYKGAYYAEPDPTESSEPNPRHAVYYYKEGYFYRAVFKVTRDGKEVYLVSLVKSDSGKNSSWISITKRKKRKRGAGGRAVSPPRNS